MHSIVFILISRYVSPVRTSYDHRVELWQSHILNMAVDVCAREQRVK